MTPKQYLGRLAASHKRPPAVIHRRLVGGPYAGQTYRQTAGQGGNTAVFEARGMRGRYHSGEWEPIERIAPDLARI